MTDNILGFNVDQLLDIAYEIDKLDYKQYLDKLKHTNIKIIKETTLRWMENTKSTGGFNGYPENDIDFNNLPDDEINYYFNNWVMANAF